MPSSRRTALALAGLLLASAGCSDTPGGSFTSGSPADVDMDAALLEQAREYAFAEGHQTQAVIVARRGVIVAEWYAEGRDASSQAASWSVAKSFTSALVGVAIERGQIPSIDEPMSTWIPEWSEGEHARITLRDVLEMSSGLEWNESYDPSDVTTSDIVQMVLSTSGSHADQVIDNQVVSPPGTVFNYSSGDTMLLSRVLSAATGASVGEYARQILFEPLGIEGARWWTDGSGDTLTYCCLDMPTRGFAAMGQLFLERGRLGGEQLVPEAWVEASLRPSRTYDGYGLQWWLEGHTEPDLPDDTFAMVGHDGQYVYVVPSLELVVARSGWYDPWRGDAIATPSLFARYPDGGRVIGRGTKAPGDFRVGELLRRILAAVR